MCGRMVMSVVVCVPPQLRSDWSVDPEVGLSVMVARIDYRKLQ